MMNTCVIEHPVVWLEFTDAGIVLSAAKTMIGNFCVFSFQSDLCGFACNCRYSNIKIQIKMRQLLWSL